MNTEDLFQDNLAQTTLHPLNLRVRYASGSLLHLEDGTEVIDFISGIGVSSFGHGQWGGGADDVRRRTRVCNYDAG